jgi:hypothetical protein
MSVGNLLGNSGHIPEPTESEVLGAAEADYFAHMDAEDGPDDEALCPECKGDGGDKWNDYCLPCPTCGGDGRLW